MKSYKYLVIDRLHPDITFLSSNMPTPVFFPIPLNEITKWVTDRVAEIESLQGEIQALHAQIAKETDTNRTLKIAVSELQSKTQSSNQQWQSWRVGFEQRETKLSVDQDAVKKAHDVLATERAGMANLGASLRNLASTMVHDIQTTLHSFSSDSDEKMGLSCFQ